MKIPVAFPGPYTISLNFKTFPNLEFFNFFNSHHDFSTFSTWTTIGNPWGQSTRASLEFASDGVSVGNMRCLALNVLHGLWTVGACINELHKVIQPGLGHHGCGWKSGDVHTHLVSKGKSLKYQLDFLLSHSGILDDFQVKRCNSAKYCTRLHLR